MKRLLGIMIAVVGVGLMGIATTKVVHPVEDGLFGNREQRAIAYAMRCVENPVQRLPVVTYRITSIDRQIGSVEQTRVDAQVTSNREVVGALVPGSIEQTPFDAQVTAYTLFALPLYRISVTVPVGCRLVSR
ncbi:MAG: hypothetical protein ACOY42_01075 [Pseudomonadota bacterium]